MSTTTKTIFPNVAPQVQDNMKPKRTNFATLIATPCSVLQNAFRTKPCVAGWFWKPLGTFGCHWELLGASDSPSGLLGAPVGHLELLGVPGSLCELLGASCELLGTSWDPLGASGSVWERLVRSLFGLFFGSFYVTFWVIFGSFSPSFSALVGCPLGAFIRDP